MFIVASLADNGLRYSFVFCLKFLLHFLVAFLWALILVNINTTLLITFLLSLGLLPSSSSALFNFLRPSKIITI